MDTTPVISSEQPLAAVKAPRSIAPIWHTLLLIVVLILFSAGGSNTEHSLAVRCGRPTQYLATIGWEWILVLYTWWGLRRRSMTLREIIGGRWNRVEDFLLEIALAAGFWVVAIVVLSALGYAMGMTGSVSKFEEVRRQLGFLVPRNNTEMLLWIGLSTTAGFCEEIIFRGYLQRQFGAWTRNAWVGLVASGVVFGAAHGYQGPKRMLLIGIFGMMFGVLAHLRRSLRPGMMAHAFHDTFTGLLLRFIVK